ncbi:MAG: hypothetical protein ACJAS4_001753 [Bacteriovoracaceae bacterium]|jgi:hypothetical protein
MTTPREKTNQSKVLWENSQISKVEFNGKEFFPTNRGHGLYVKTTGNDTLIDLRFSSERPFLGHTHPLLSQHNYGNLKHELIMNHYSVPKTEFVRMIETFQKINYQEILSDNFKITYHNIVINLDESLFETDKKEIISNLDQLIKENPDTFFWIIEKDLSLMSNDNLIYLKELLEDKEIAKHTHFCLDAHFVSSIYIYSHHLFSEDGNMQLFLGIKNLFETIISTTIDGKNSIDFKTIDNFLSNELNTSDIKRVGRYLIIPKTISESTFNENGIIISKNQKPNQTTLSFPIACTKEELLDTLQRIKLLI